MPENDLEKLKKKLYQPESKFEERLEKPTPFSSEKKREKIQSTEWQEEKNKKLTPGQIKKIKIIGGLSLVVFFAVIGFLFWQGMNSFDKNKVVLEIEGAERIVSGDEITYVVGCKNNTNLALHNLQLIFRYPQDAIPSKDKSSVETIEFSNLEPGQEVKTEFPGRLVGLKGDKKKALAELSYSPGNLSSRFSNEAEFETEIVSVPLIVNFDLPEKLVSGQSFDFSLVYSNQSGVSFDNLQVKMEYPKGFIFESSQPESFDENNFWSLGNVVAGEQGKIFIKGTISGEENENKAFKAQIGENKEEFIPYAEATGAVQISQSPLFISQTVNNSTDYIAKVGDTLKYRIEYKNKTDVGIRNVFINVKLDGKALDFSTLNAATGSFNGNNNTIVWNASNQPDLEFLGSGQGGEINFSIRIKNPLPINNFVDKNFTVVSDAIINSENIPLSLEKIEIAGKSKLTTKVTSHLTLQAQAFYFDDELVNSGPLPPKVGQKTTYTIKWRLVNRNNDLSDVKIVAYLPPHVEWVGIKKPSSADLSYNSQTGQVIWQVGNLAAGTGVLAPVRQVAFQIAITPTVVDAGNLVELIGQSKVSAHDNFVDLELTDTTRSIDSNLPDDPQVNNQGTVVQ